jgi:hypothetical protein
MKNANVVGQTNSDAGCCSVESERTAIGDARGGSEAGEEFRKCAKRQTTNDARRALRLLGLPRTLLWQGPNSAIETAEMTFQARPYLPGCSTQLTNQ